MADIKILVTGAGGFIGRHVVDAIRADGHGVVAVVRDPKAALSNWTNDSGVAIAKLDLIAPDAKDELAQLLPEIDAIVHAAATMSGDPDRQIRETLGATDTVLEAMSKSRPIPRMVLVSSMSVYDGQATEVGQPLTEDSLLERAPKQRDAYCQAKLSQEFKVREAAAEMGFELWIMRPGAVFGAGRLWNGHLGHPVGKLLVQLEKKGEVPVSFVEHTAKALELAAITPASGIEVVNVVDDDLPDRSKYVAALRHGGWPRFVFPLNWRILSALGRVLQKVPKLGQRLPGLLVPATLHARMKPIRYGNSRLHDRLSIPQQLPFEHVFATAMALEEGDQK